jgi:putative flippase GtrA
VSDAIPRQFVSFALAGGVGFLVEAVVLKSVTLAGMNPVAGRFVSFPAAVIVTWLLNRRFAFAAQRSADKGAEFRRYLSGQAISAGLGMPPYFLLVVYSPLFARYPLLALVVSAIVALIFNFIFARYFAFRGGRDAVSPNH